MANGPLYDYIVCGAGTAGCLLANRLSADKNKHVLLIEAGGNDDYVWVHIPVGYLYCIGNARTDWLYSTESDPGLNGRSLRYPRGKVLGGSSSINGMIYMRGQVRDYDGWGAGDGFGPNPGWSWAECLPYFLKHEDFHRGADDFHAAPGFDPTGQRPGGEWRVEKQRLRWDILDAFAAAAQQAGIPPSTDFNRGDNEGVGYFEVNQRGGVRWNAAKAFLRPIQRRMNMQVWTGAHVSRLLLEQSAGGFERGAARVTGVEVVGAGPRGGRQQAMLAEGGEVLLAAGAIGTPQILQLSGIGPVELLQQHAITPIHPLAGVGANLQDHLQLRMAFKVKNVATLNTQLHSWWEKAKIGLEYALRRTGPMTMPPSQLGAFVKSDPSQATPNLEYHVQPLSLDRFGEPPHRFPAFTASVCNLRPTSRGHVRIVSSDPRAYPAITCNYLSTDEDRKVAVDSIRLTRRIVTETQALKPYEPEEFVPGPRLQTDAELVKAAGDIGTTIFHPVGTCKMGRADDATAVVDPQLRVRGIDRLRVIDASIMPTVTSGNTNAPTVMIAERGAGLLRSRT